MVVNGIQNGNFNGGLNSPSAMGDPQMAQMREFLSQYEPTALHERIKLRETALQPLFTRFDNDFSLWRLREFTGIDNELYDSENYLHMTSNAPRTYANKITNAVNKSAMVIRIDQQGRNEIMRRFDSAKERLAHTFLEMADKRLKRIGRPSVRKQSSWEICIRGPVFARTMLRIDQQTGQTIVDVTPWDSRNVVWDSGPEGLAWVAYKMRKTRSQILREYGVRLDQSTNAFNNHDQQGFIVIDYYDGLVNTVFTDDLVVLKPVAPHMRPRMPVAYNFGGDVPLLSNDTTSDEIKDFSESIYESNRGVYKWDNYTRSIGLHLTAEARDPKKLLRSPDGSFALDADASLPGAEIAVRTDQDVEPLKPVELTNTAAQMMSLIGSEVQQGSLSSVNFGSVPFAASGFAISNLQSSNEEKIEPRIEQSEDFHLMVLEILMEQYQTGMFPTLTVKGRGRSGMGFSEQVPPEVVQIGGEITIELMPNQPENDVQKIQTAQLLRQPGVNGEPLVDDSYIRDKFLGILDADSMEDRIRGQLAERGSPLASMWSNIQSARNEGDMELAFLYQQEMLYLAFQMWAATQGILPPPQIPGVGQPEFGSPTAIAQQASGGGGVSSNASPPQAMGINAAPSQQAGPNVPPGSPRPGAQAQPGQVGG